MNLYILRHAIAEEHAPSTHSADSERRLTPAGVKKMRRIAKGMAAQGLDFEVVISSPYVRAKQTADIVVAELGIAQRLTLSPALATNGDPKKLVEELHRHHRLRKSILLVGHEPYLSKLISTLISGEANISIDLKKGGLCKLTTNGLRYGRCATLDWLIAPTQGKRIG